jgi:hypothetical protein
MPLFRRRSRTTDNDIRFLEAIEAQVPRRTAIHAIVDNYATHKHPTVREWLMQHPR